MASLKFPLILKVAIFTIFTNNVASHMVGNNPYRRREILDRNGKYQLEWLVDWSLKKITFDVAVETLGYVGFGLSAKGKMSGADLIIGGVTKTGKSYFSDYHAVGNQEPELDPSQDWTLHQAKENGSHTFLSFSRKFDTLDPQDYPITENTIALIWAYGERDSPLQYHYRDRGSFNVYLLHPDFAPYIERDPITQDPLKIGSDDQQSYRDENIKVWTIPRVWQIPSSDTTYWCTMHAAPRLPGKHHIIGYDLRFGDEESRRSIHHLQISRCNPPPGRSAKAMFSPFLKHRGQLCYQLEIPTGPMPTEYCTHLVSGMAMGQRIMFHPPEVGLPFGFSPDEYYLFQVHYDNPQRRSDFTVDIKLDLYYTSKLRQHDGGFFAFGHIFPGISPSILVPPSSIDHQIYGHCGETCTKRMFPPEGIKFYAIVTHSHLSGRKLKVSHFRNGEELDPITSDDNFSQQFQQVRVLNRQVQILPGDHLMMNCEYDNTWTNGTVVGGFSTRQEMCNSFAYYHTHIDYSVCVSEIISEKERRRFLSGVRNITWSEQNLEFVVDAPHPLAGLTISQVSDNHVKWNSEKRNELQRFHTDHPQVNTCLDDRDVIGRVR